MDTFIFQIYLSFGHFAISMLITLGIVLTIESPLLSLEKLLFPCFFKPRQSSSQPGASSPSGITNEACPDVAVVQNTAASGSNVRSQRPSPPPEYSEIDKTEASGVYPDTDWSQKAQNPGEPHQLKKLGKECPRIVSCLNYR